VYCRKCGARLPEDSVFCQECGAKLVLQASPEAVTDAGAEAGAEAPEATVSTEAEGVTGKIETEGVVGWARVNYKVKLWDDPDCHHWLLARPGPGAMVEVLEGGSESYYRVRYKDTTGYISTRTSLEFIQPASGTVHANHRDRYRAAREERSFITPAILTLVLYFVLWLPGLVANLVYLQAANRDEALLGHEPEGLTFLNVLLAFGLILGLAIVIVAIWLVSL